MEMFYIRKIFNEICYDCMDIILNYVDPIDILRLIYYNKHYLYLNKECSEERNITTDSMQLFLYEKFYTKVLKNLEIYVNDRNADWKKIDELLNDNTVISGGSLLQAIYGSIENETIIPMNFYHEKQFQHNHGINGYSEDLKKEKNTIAVLSDIDIYTTTKEKLFDSRGIKTYIESGEISIAETEDGNVHVIFEVRVGYDLTVNIEDQVMDKIDVEKMEDYDYKENQLYKDFIENREQEIEAYINIHLMCESKLYKITEFEKFSKENLTKRNMFVNAYNNSHNIVHLGSTKTFIAEQMKNAIADYDDIFSILFYGDNTFLKELKNSKDNMCKQENIFGDYYYLMSRILDPAIGAGKIAYDSLELKEHVNINGEKERYWEESIYDPFTKYEEYLLEAEEETWDGPFLRTRRLHSHRSKKIVPIVIMYEKELLLNVIYVDGTKYISPKNFIEADFDINICRQTYNGKKICLYDINDLIKKVCKYNLNHIMNHMEDDNLIDRYVCFRKRLEKYKTRGFKIENEKELINNVRYMLYKF